MTRRARLSLFAALAVLAAGCGGGDRPVPVILVSIDTLRAFDVSGLGYERRTTPNLDRFAEEAVVFRDAVCNSNNTLISHASMLTSLYPSVHGVEPGIGLSDERRTLSEVLRDEGYATAFFAAHGDWLTQRYGFGRGVDAFRSGYVKAPAINRWALEWLEAEPRDPFFLFLHYYDVHSDFPHEGDLPYVAPPPYRGTYTAGYDGDFTGCSPDRSSCASAWLADLSRAGILLPERDRAYVRALYDEEILYTDAMLGELFDRLRELGLYDRSLIVVTADHGEEFQEHGQFLHESVYEPVVRVPLWIRFPGGEPRGPVDTLAEGVDLVPTILDYLGVEALGGTQGESLLPVLRGSEPKTEYALIQSTSMRSSRFKAKTDGRGGWVLFDLAEDPGETTNVAGEHPEVLEDMTAHLRELMDRHEEMAARFGGRIPEARGPRVEVSEEERRRLEALGYDVSRERGGTTDEGGRKE